MKYEKLFIFVFIFSILLSCTKSEENHVIYDDRELCMINGGINFGEDCFDTWTLDLKDIILEYKKKIY